MLPVHFTGPYDAAIKGCYAPVTHRIGAKTHTGVMSTVIVIIMMMPMKMRLHAQMAGQTIKHLKAETVA